MARFKKLLFTVIPFLVLYSFAGRSTETLVPSAETFVLPVSVPPSTLFLLPLLLLFRSPQLLWQLRLQLLSSSEILFALISSERGSPRTFSEDFFHIFCKDNFFIYQQL